MEEGRDMRMLAVLAVMWLVACRDGGGAGDAGYDGDMAPDGFFACEAAAGSHYCPRGTECCEGDDSGAGACCATGEMRCNEDESAFCEATPGAVFRCSENEAGVMRCGTDEGGCLLVYESCGGALCQDADGGVWCGD